jgi:urease accessory protein
MAFTSRHLVLHVGAASRSSKEIPVKNAALCLAACLVAAPAMAHTGSGDAVGFVQGLIHPLLGADHLLAMVAVGLWSGLALSRHRWLGGATFMAAMALGAGLTFAGLDLPMREALTLASVLVFALMAFGARRGLAPALPLAVIAVFALAHGAAHAAEASGTAGIYMAGFLITSALLHLAGYGLAHLGARPMLPRAIATGLALSGLWLIAA